MDQKKVGSFLKELRKEKGITQEKFAEELAVSGRTVSRWETGSNLPDISLLVHIADLDSGFMIFPDDTDEMLEVEYTSNLKTGMFDTDGCIILKSKYSKENYDKEIKRLSEITCEIKYQNESVKNEVRYDENMYHYPAYITSDGFDYVYEYALLDEANDTIIYVLLSYPNATDLVKYKEYLKKNVGAYILDHKNVLEEFTIYVHKFGDIYYEYTDMQ